MEGTPNSERGVTESEDRVLNDLHLCVEGRRQCSQRDAQRIHQSFECCRAFHFYELYRQGKMPTLDHIETSLNKLIERMDPRLAQDSEGQKIIQMLRGRSNVIKGTVQQYVESVIASVRSVKEGAFRADPETFRRIDERRTRRHNALLASLNELVTTLERAEDFGLCDKKDFFQWVTGMDFALPQEIVPVFARSTLKDRDLIRDWALAADYDIHFRSLLTILKKQEGDSD